MHFVYFFKGVFKHYDVCLPTLRKVISAPRVQGRERGSQRPNFQKVGSKELKVPREGKRVGFNPKHPL